MEFLEQITSLLKEVEEKEEKNIKAAAKIIFDSMIEDGILQIFATGHSHMFGEEMFYRAGGLVQVNPILEPFIMQHEGAKRSTKFERLPGIAKVIYDSLDKQANDPFIVVSNSGINACIVEFADIARRDGHKVIGITSKDASSTLVPRNDLNKHLYELCDVVIDNHVPYGDGLVSTPYGKIGACSSVVSSYIAQRLNIEIVKLYEEANIPPAIFLSANVPGGDEHNKDLTTKYIRRIKSLY